VARGFSQKEGIYYEDTFSPIEIYTSIRIVLVIAAIKKWKIHQMDVKTTFLNGEIEEEVYVDQPQGFETHDINSHVCRLNKSLYGLNKSPRAWYERMDNFLTSLGFSKNKADPKLYCKVDDGTLVIIWLFIDDMFLTGEEKPIAKSKRKLSTKFEMKYLGIMHYFLGIEVWKRQNEIFLNQGKYTLEIMKRFDMMDCNSMPKPMVKKLKFLSDTSLEHWMSPCIDR
jgi:hypothetical protein